MTNSNEKKIILSELTEQEIQKKVFLAIYNVAAGIKEARIHCDLSLHKAADLLGSGRYHLKNNEEAYECMRLQNFAHVMAVYENIMTENNIAKTPFIKAVCDILFLPCHNFL